MDLNPGSTEAWRVKILPQWICKSKSNDSPQENVPKCEDCNLPFAKPPIQGDKKEVKIVKKELKSAIAKANKASKKEKRELICLLCRKKNKKGCSKKCSPPTLTELASSINYNCCHCVRVFAQYIKDVIRFVLA